MRYVPNDEGARTHTTVALQQVRASACSWHPGTGAYNFLSIVRHNGQMLAQGPASLAAVRGAKSLSLRMHACGSRSFRELFMLPFVITLGCLRILAFFAAKQPHGDDADLVENQKGYGHDQLVNHIRSWGQNGGDDEIDQDRVTAVAAQPGLGHHAQPRQQHHEDRHFKDDAKSQKQLQGEGKILGDHWQRGEVGVAIADKKAKGGRKDDQITKGGTTQKTQGGQDGKRQDDPLFVVVETGGDKAPDLGKNHRASENQAADQCQFQIKKNPS